MSDPDLENLQLILRNIDAFDDEGQQIKFSHTKEFKKLTCLDDAEVNEKVCTLIFDLIRNPQENTKTRLFSLKFITQCLIEADILFLETFQDHSIMNYFSEQSLNHSKNKTAETVGIHFLNANNPSFYEKQNGQNFILLMIETCQLFSKAYPSRYPSNSKSRFRETIENMEESKCYLPLKPTFLKQKLETIQKSLSEQNYQIFGRPVIPVMSVRSNNSPFHSRIVRLSSECQRNSNLQNQNNNNNTSNGQAHSTFYESILKLHEIYEGDNLKCIQENVTKIKEIRLIVKKNEKNALEKMSSYYVSELKKIKNEFQNNGVTQNEKIKKNMKDLTQVDEDLIRLIGIFKDSKDMNDLQIYFNREQFSQMVEGMQEILEINRHNNQAGGGNKNVNHSPNNTPCSNCTPRQSFQAGNLNKSINSSISNGDNEQFDGINGMPNIARVQTLLKLEQRNSLVAINQEKKEAQDTLPINQIEETQSEMANQKGSAETIKPAGFIHSINQKQESFSQLDKTSSNSPIAKGISFQDHEAAITQERKEQNKLRLIIEEKDKEIANQKEVIVSLMKEIQKKDDELQKLQKKQLNMK